MIYSTDIAKVKSTSSDLDTVYKVTLNSKTFKSRTANVLKTKNYENHSNICLPKLELNFKTVSKLTLNKILFVLKVSYL